MFHYLLQALFHRHHITNKIWKNPILYFWLQVVMYGGVVWLINMWIWIGTWIYSPWLQSLGTVSLTAFNWHCSSLEFLWGQLRRLFFLVQLRVASTELELDLPSAPLPLTVILCPAVTCCVLLLCSLSCPVLLNCHLLFCQTHTCTILILLFSFLLFCFWSVLSRSGVWPRVSSHGSQRELIVPAEMWLLIHYHSNQLCICYCRDTFSWLLRNGHSVILVFNQTRHNIIVAIK
jgi:hypothetical protein